MMTTLRCKVPIILKAQMDTSINDNNKKWKQTALTTRSLERGTARRNTLTGPVIIKDHVTLQNALEVNRSFFLFHHMHLQSCWPKSWAFSNKIKQPLLTFWTVSACLNTTNPNPLDCRVSRSVFNVQLVTSPIFSKYSLRSSVTQWTRKTITKTVKHVVSQEHF